jgi:hypothetical protein
MRNVCFNRFYHCFYIFYACIHRRTQKNPALPLIRNAGFHLTVLLYFLSGRPTFP